MKEHFPGLETDEALEEHKNTVLTFMSKESAICAKMIRESINMSRKEFSIHTGIPVRTFRKRNSFAIWYKK